MDIPEIVVPEINAVTDLPQVAIPQAPPVTLDIGVPVINLTPFNKCSKPVNGAGLLINANKPCGPCIGTVEKIKASQKI